MFKYRFYLRRHGVSRFPPFQAGSPQGEAEDVHISIIPDHAYGIRQITSEDPEGWQARHVVLPLWGEGHLLGERNVGDKEGSADGDHSTGCLD